MSHISLKIPSDDEKALVAGATMLLTLAGKIPEMELPAGDGVSDDTTVLHAQQDAVIAPPPPPPAATEEEVIAPPPVATDGEPSDTPTTEEEATATTGPELDNSDPPLPWDARIHSGSKAKLQDGTWRKKRGVDPEDYNRVVEELKQLMAAPVLTPEPVVDDTAAPQGQQDAAITPPPPPPVPSPEVAGISPTESEPVPDTFPAFLRAVTMKVQAKELTIEEVNNALQPHGVANLQLLGGRPDLIPQVWADLVAPK